MNSSVEIFYELYDGLYDDLYDEVELMPFTYQEPYANNYIIQRCNPNKYSIIDNINEQQYVPYNSLENIDSRYLNTVSILKYSFEDLNDAEMYVRNICKNKSDIGFYSTYTPSDNSYLIYMTTFNEERCKFLLIYKKNSWHIIRLYTTYWSIPRIQETFK